MACFFKTKTNLVAVSRAPQVDVLLQQERLEESADCLESFLRLRDRDFIHARLGNSAPLYMHAFVSSHVLTTWCAWGMCTYISIHAFTHVCIYWLGLVILSYAINSCLNTHMYTRWTLLHFKKHALPYLMGWTAWQYVWMLILSWMPGFSSCPCNLSIT